MKKKCKHCGVTKKETEFYKDYPWTYYRTVCKQCERAKQSIRDQQRKTDLMLEREASKRRFENVVRTMSVPRFYE